MKAIVFFMVILFTATLSSAQNNLPSNIQAAIPPNYNVDYGQYVKSDFVTGVDIGLTIPGENACDDGLEDNVTVSINIMEMNNNDIVRMQEEQIPFEMLLPTKESLPQENNDDGFITYSETELTDIDGGRIAYYTYTGSCIMSQYESFDGILLILVHGSYAHQLNITLDGPVSKDKAFEIINGLIETFGSGDLSETE